MTTKKLNDRLWTVAKFGVPATLILLVIGALLKLRVLIIATDLIGLVVIGVIIAAILTEVVLHVEKRDVRDDTDKRYGSPDEESGAER